MNGVSVQMLSVVVLAAVILAVEQFPTVAGRKPDFKAALKMVNEAKNQSGNINYTSFCSKTPQGSSKLGCQIKAMDDVGLLVCLEAVVCEAKLQSELSDLKTIRDANLKVLEYDDEIIDKLKCGARGSKDVNCYGFLEKWIQDDDGKIRSLRSSIFSGNKSIEVLTDWVIQYQAGKAACLETSSDLKAIQKFMTPISMGRRDDGYNRICDLQGFFMKAGGFVISDPDGVLKNTTSSNTCHDKNVFPTTKKVIEGLKQMSDKFDRHCSGGAPAGLPKNHLTFFSMFFLLVLKVM